MPKMVAMFKINVVETLERQVEVEAESEQQAMSMVEEMYQNEDIVLDSSDFQDVEFFHEMGE